MIRQIFKQIKRARLAGYKDDRPVGWMEPTWVCIDSFRGPLCGRMHRYGLPKALDLGCPEHSTKLVDRQMHVVRMPTHGVGTAELVL